MDGGSEGIGGGGRLSKSVPFLHVAELLEKISSDKTSDKRKTRLENFFKYYRQQFEAMHMTLDSEKAGGDSLYPVMRILLPDVDRGRRAYGFKSAGLARMLAQILGLDKNTKDGSSLLNFKDPTKSGPSSGDLGDTIFTICKEEFSVPKGNPVMLFELHELLDSLARSPDSGVNQEMQKKFIQEKIQRFTPVEMKWLVRILLKEMRLGFSSKSVIYAVLHKDAKTLAEGIEGELELLCQKLNDPNVGVSGLDLSLFHHFTPMLATRMTSISTGFEGGRGSDGPSKKSKADSVTLPPPPFYVETKWDGERFQIHYDGKEFRYLSRRNIDYSKQFNETMTPRLRLRISLGIKSFILDGEMMAYHKQEKGFTLKGDHIDVKTINASTHPNHCPVFVTFDVVYLNGSSLLNMPLHQRKVELKKVFSPRDDVIRLSVFKTLNSADEVTQSLDSAIQDGEEGLIVKNMNSTYEPGKRNLSWLKIKPEFIYGNSVDDLDLVILGVYYAKSDRMLGEINRFLLGVVDSSSGKDMYYSIVRVGRGGLWTTSLNGLVADLTPKLVKTVPNNVQIGDRKKPDFLIDPTKSIVVQVKASEICSNDEYSLNYTLRFPRIVKIRRDKRPREVLSVQEFTRIREASGGKLAKRTDEKFAQKRKQDSNEEKQSRKRKSSAADSDDSDDDLPLPGPSAKPKLLSIDKSNKLPMLTPFMKKAGSIPRTPTKSGTSVVLSKFSKSSTNVVKDVFNSKLFCVYGSSTWKSTMELKIKQFGGEITQSADVKNLFAIVGERRTSVLIQKALRAGRYDVLEPTWIEKCAASGIEEPLVPIHFWGMTSTTRERFAEDFDEYGDSYRKENTLEETKAIVMRMIEVEKEKDAAKASAFKKPAVVADDSDTDFDPDEALSGPSLESQVLKELFPDKSYPEGIRWKFLKNVVIAFRGKAPFILETKVEFFGGKVAKNESSSGVTHVVVCEKGASKEQSSALIVSQKWLEDCLKKKQVLDVQGYLVK